MHLFCQFVFLIICINKEKKLYF